MAVPVGSYQDIHTIRTRRKHVIAMTERGFTAEEIARELNISMRTVQRHRAGHRTGEPLVGPGGYRRATEERQAQIIELIDLGWSARRISAKLHVCLRTVRRYRARHRAQQ